MVIIYLLIGVVIVFAIYQFIQSNQSKFQREQTKHNTPEDEPESASRISVEVSVQENTNGVDQDKLLREATAQKKNGNHDKAVELLRKAYNEIAKTNMEYDIKTFLRLPLYLQKAGRADEAWREFNQLLTHGFPNQPARTFLYEHNKSKIYDKMRLFLQREGRKSLAINYGISSYLTDLKGRYISGQEDERYMENFNRYATEEAVERVVGKLVKKAKREDIKEELCSLVQKEIEKMPDVYEDEIEDSISSLLNKKMHNKGLQADRLRWATRLAAKI